MELNEKPAPIYDFETAPYWDYCKQHELRMQKCLKCSYIRNPSSIICPKCHSMETEWVNLSGEGKVYSYTIYHKPYHIAFRDEVPYSVAIIELEEGPRMISNIVECDLKDIKIDMPVKVKFFDISEKYSLPKFIPQKRI